nr:class I SAM-dependent methyltransferase [Geomicrobium halophilum]
MEKLKFGNIRRNLLEKAEGHVLEIGSGTGVNFSYYDQADQVMAIEADPMMREKSMEKAKKVNVPIEVIIADGERLPFADDQFDTVVATLVFCTIADPDRALQEVRRVCKRNGRVLFFEHVRVDRSLLGRIQDLATPVWKRLFDGCHLNRHTLQRVQQAGFNITKIEKHFMNIFYVAETRNHKGREFT